MNHFPLHGLLHRRFRRDESPAHGVALQFPAPRSARRRAGCLRRTLAVQHVNVDTLLSTIAPIPDSLEARVLDRFSWSDDDL